MQRFIDERDDTIRQRTQIAMPSLPVFVDKDGQRKTRHDLPRATLRRVRTSRGLCRYTRLIHDRRRVVAQASALHVNVAKTGAS